MCYCIVTLKVCVQFDKHLTQLLVLWHSKCVFILIFNWQSLWLIIGHVFLWHSKCVFILIIIWQPQWHCDTSCIRSYCIANHLKLHGLIVCTVCCVFILPTFRKVFPWSCSWHAIVSFCYDDMLYMQWERKMSFDPWCPKKYLSLLLNCADIHDGVKYLTKLIQ